MTESTYNTNTEQQAMIESVRKLSLKEIPRYKNERYYNTLPRELFSSFAALGICGLSVSQKYGGLEAGHLTSALLMEEISAVDLAPAIFISVHNMVSGLIEGFGDTNQKEKFLQRLSCGELLGAYALTEPQAGSDAANLKTSAKKTEQGYLLNGEKCYISSAGFCDLYLVFARTSSEANRGKGISAFLVEADLAGISVSSPEKKMGCELSPISSVSFNNVALPADSLLGDLDDGYRIALSGLSGGRLSISACANGLSREAINIALAHLKQRQQFGRTLFEISALQSILADMKIKYEASKLLTIQAGKSLDNDVASDESRLYSSIAKCHNSDAAMSITTDAVQLLGGAGYISDYRVEQLMRDAKMLQIVEGTNQIQRRVIAGLMGK
jgi:alkylation response protein AidB-like acyl-CoA dehydrogenase